MIILNDRQIKEAKAKAKIEVDREIYTISINEKEITINGDWSIERKNKGITEDVISAIEEYCTQSNIAWEQQSTYSAWCD